MNSGMVLTQPKSDSGLRRRRYTTKPSVALLIVVLSCLGRTSVAADTSTAKPSAPPMADPSAVTAPATVSTIDTAATSTSPKSDKPPAAPPPIPMELQPYRIHISVAFEQDATLPIAVRREVLEKLTVWVDRTYAQMWEATIEENLWLSPVGPAGLSRLTAAIVESHVPDKSTDKLLVLTVSAYGGGWRLSGREWDRLTGQVCAPASRLATDRRTLSTQLGAVLHDLFHPLVFIEAVEASKTATVRIRAGEFPPGDPSAEQWAAGAFFQPVFLNYNKAREITKVQFVPWTYVEAQSAERAVGKGAVYTGLSLPLGKNNKRMESWAIGVRPTFTETKLKITPHNNPTKPLTGYQVKVYERRMVPPLPPDPNVPTAAASSDDKVATENKDASTENKPPEPPALVPKFEPVASHVTDRRGQVTIPLNPEKPLIWLYVSSGGSLLGRFPYIPGLNPLSSVELPDDSLRLHIESRLELLRAEFIDTIARRALFTGRAKAAARAADWPRFTETLAEMDQQPNGKYFQTLLDAIKAATLKQAQAAKNKALEKKIEKLCKESADLIERHLSVEKLDTVRTELLELKKIDDEANAAENPARRPLPAKKPTATKE